MYQQVPRGVVTPVNGRRLLAGYGTESTYFGELSGSKDTSHSSLRTAPRPFGVHRGAPSGQPPRSNPHPPAPRGDVLALPEQPVKRPIAHDRSWTGDARQPLPQYFVGTLVRDRFIILVSQFLDREADANSKHATLPTYSEPESVFFSVSKPEIPTRDYVRRLVTYTQCSPSAFIVMLIYLRRIAVANKRLFITPYNMHRLLVTALTLACKMLDDRCFSNVHYAKVGGIPTAREMNRLELQFLAYLKYKLHVTLDDYLGELRALETFYPPLSPVSPISPISIQTCGSDHRASGSHLEIEESRSEASGESGTCCYSSDKSEPMSADGVTYSNVRNKLPIDRSFPTRSKVAPRASALASGKRNRKDVRGMNSQGRSTPHVHFTTEYNSKIV